MPAFSSRSRRRAVLTAAIAALSSLGALPAAATTAGQALRVVSAPPAPVGYDISFPQCGQRRQGYPVGQAFAIVGVNGGTASTANPCLGPSRGQTGQLSWAAASPGLLAQPRISFYLVAADPGPGGADWPPAGSRPLRCGGGWSTGCAYDYGHARAANALRLARWSAMVARLSHLPSADPATAPWWLDAELGPPWAGPKTPGWASLNVAALEGFIDGLSAGGVSPARIGFYSTAFQWVHITGLDATTSRVHFSLAHPDWVAGARTLEEARAACAPARSFTGGRVTLTQFTAPGFDGDYRCP